MLRIVMVSIGIPLMFTSMAQSCADGPDFYRVVDVANDDVLNVRSGPGLGFSVVGELPPNAVDVRNLDQVPTNVCDAAGNLNAFEERNFWTKIQWQTVDTFVAGWAKSRYLSE